MEVNRILCGDCLELFKGVPDGSVDVVVTSPPYNLLNTTGNGLKNPGRNGRWASCGLQSGYESYSDNMPYPEYVAWQRRCLSEMLRVLKPTGAIFYNHKWRVQGGLIQDRREIVDGFPVRQIIIWQRSGGVNFTQHFYLPTYEVIYVIAKEKFRLRKGGNAVGDIWSIVQDRRNPHPAPFPEELVSRILTTVLPERGLVLDPFMGSGTVAVVAKRLGWDYLGFELSEEYCKEAEVRLMLGDLYLMEK